MATDRGGGYPVGGINPRPAMTPGFNAGRAPTGPPPCRKEETCDTAYRTR
jgi:hypothetical protein